LSFRIKILGNNAAVPAHGRNQSSQLVMVHNQFLLLDCGEGTQMRLLEEKINFNKIHHIFISHLHGDHYYGLMGLISTMQLYGRNKSLHIYAAPILREIIFLNLKASETILNFQIEFHPLERGFTGFLLEQKYFTVRTFPLEHRVSCHGFLIQETPKPYRIRKDRLHPGIKLQHIGSFLKGEDASDDDGNILYRKDDYTLPPKKQRSYAYCSDTKFLQSTIDHVRGVDALYHESTFLDDLKGRAEKTFHSTAKEAAMVAKMANAGSLYLGHFSTRYKELQPFLNEARAIFEQTFLSEESKDIIIED